MKVGILTADDSSYSRLAHESCRLAGVEPVVLAWTQDLEENLAQIEKEKVEFLIIHGHASHHGFKLAQVVVEHLGVEPVVISSTTVQYPESCPIEQICPGVGAAERIARCITEGTKLCATRAELESFQATVTHLERALKMVKEEERRYRENAARIRSRRRQCSHS